MQNVQKLYFANWRVKMRKTEKLRTQKKWGVWVVELAGKSDVKQSEEVRGEQE